MCKKVVSDSQGLVDFALGITNSVLNLPDGRVKFFGGIQITEVLRQILFKFLKTLCGLKAVFRADLAK